MAVTTNTGRHVSEMNPAGGPRRVPAARRPRRASRPWCWAPTDNAVPPSRSSRPSTWPRRARRPTTCGSTTVNSSRAPGRLNELKAQLDAVTGDETLSARGCPAEGADVLRESRGTRGRVRGPGRGTQRSAAQFEADVDAEDGHDRSTSPDEMRLVMSALSSGKMDPVFLGKRYLEVTSRPKSTWTRADGKFVSR